MRVHQNRRKHDHSDVSSSVAPFNSVHYLCRLHGRESDFTRHLKASNLSKSVPADPKGLILAKYMKISRNSIIYTSLKEIMYARVTSLTDGYQLEGSAP